MSITFLDKTFIGLPPCTQYDSKCPPRLIILLAPNIHCMSDNTIHNKTHCNQELGTNFIPEPKALVFILCYIKVH